MNAFCAPKNHNRHGPWVLLVLLLCLWGCSSAAFTLQDRTSVRHLVVLFTNDTHGHPVKFQYGPIPDAGGLPARATLVKEIRRQHPNVLVLDAGDLNTGAAESDFFKAEPDIVGYNYIGYDAIVLGNHEFDHPMDVLKRQMAGADFPFLSANVKTRQGTYVATPYIIKDFDGFKVAIMGLTAKETRITGNPQHIRDIVFQDEVTAARELVPKLRREADMVIALTHLGIYEDDAKGSRRLAAQVGGIDLIVDGNTHTKLKAPIVIRNPDTDRDTLIVQAWQYGLVLGRIDLWIRQDRIIDYAMELIPINLKKAIRKPDGGQTYAYIGKKIDEDPELLKRLQPYMDKVESFLSEEIGYAEETFWNRYQRKRETALGDLVADAMLWYMSPYRPDFALTNAGAIRAAIPEGPIKKKAVYDILPFDSTAVALSLKGKDVLSLFDFIAAIQPGEGAFPQVSKGVSVTLNREVGNCTDIRINGEPIDPDRVYRLVVNSYMAEGGDGYKILSAGFDKVDSCTPQREILIKYIKHLGGRLRPKIHGRIKIVSGPESPDGIEGTSRPRMPLPVGSRPLGLAYLFTAETLEQPCNVKGGGL